MVPATVESIYDQIGGTAAVSATVEELYARVLGAALAPERGPAHAYLLHGPAGTGKRDAARAFAAELLSRGARDPENARMCWRWRSMSSPAKYGATSGSPSTRA